MARTPKPRNLSKKFLMGVAITALPLAGCDVIAPTTPVSTDAASQSRVTATADEFALFERARDSRTVASAEEFLQSYPNSELIRRLLLNLPSSTLRGISDQIVAQLKPATVNTLPFRVKQALGVLVQDSGGQGDSGPGDGYSG